MKLINPSVELVKQDSGILGIFKQIEKAARNCYSKDAEILTENGFVNVQEISPDDLVLTYNKNSNQLEYQKSNMIKKWYSGKMITVNHANIDFCVTPDHRMFVSKASEKNYDFLEAKYLFGIKGSKQNRFRIPKYFLNSSINNKEYSEELNYTKSVNCGFLGYKNKTIKYTINDDFLILVGAYITEGHSIHGEKYGSGSNLCITQSEHNSLYTDVIEALTNLNIKFRITSDPRKPEIKWIMWGNSVDVEAFDTWFGRYAKNKHLPDWFRKLSARQLSLLLTTMYKGDGSHSTTRNERYLSISPILLNQVQEIWILLGKNASTKYDSEVSQKCYTEQSLRDSWIISKDQLKEVEYNNYVYCPSTDNGIVCIRYNGKTMWCGNCYKSEDKTTDNSWEHLLTNIKSRGHLSPFEFGTVYLTVSHKSPIYDPNYMQIIDIVNFYSHNKYSRIKRYTEDHYEIFYYITTNMRVILENNRIDDLQYFVGPTDKHVQRVCFKIVTDRGVLAEITRHRIFSFAVESTRYCNYSKNKFNNELTFIIPCWLGWKEQTVHKGDFEKSGSGSIDSGIFINSLLSSEDSYLYLLKEGWKPQQARQVLPNALKTEIMMCGFIDDYDHFFDLRMSEAAHPSMRQVAYMMHSELYPTKNENE